MKFTITIDSERELDYPLQCKNLMNAQHMHLAINTYYDEVFRSNYKYALLTQQQQELLEEITENLYEHFKEFTDN